jgi:AcrR family transcriptional regulator
VARSQRERLFAAMVSATAERGYAATAVADLLRRSGVSRSSFYAHFAGKDECFGAAVEQLAAETLALISARYAVDGAPAERARSALEAFVRLCAVQPAAARLCLVESYAAGPAGLEPMQRAVSELTELAARAFAEMPERAAMPPDLVRAIGGGIHRVLYRRLLTHREAELPELGPELWEWAMSYPAPPAPLRLRGRRPAPGAAAPGLAAGDPELRIVRALAAVAAAKGYRATTIADVCTTAAVSPATFYVHFESKEDALLACLDYSGAQLAAATVPATRRARSWPDAVRIAYGAMCGFLAAEPAFARLRAVEVYAAGTRAIEQRDAAGAEILQSLLPEDVAAGLSPLTAEAVLGSVYMTMQDKVKGDGPERLAEIAPLLTYVTLAPLLGAEQACEVANGDGRRRPQP